MVQVMGSSQPATLAPLLVSLAALRGSHGFNLEGAVDGVVGAAIAATGPRLVLQAVPLNISAAENEDREFRSSWLLPVLRENIKNTELSFFSEYFLPLAAKCFDRSHACAAKQDLIGQKAYEALTYQVSNPALSSLKSEASILLFRCGRSCLDSATPPRTWPPASVELPRLLEFNLAAEKRRVVLT